MNLVFFLKIFCDLCYYFVFAGFFAGAYGQNALQFPAILGLSFVACLCRLVWDKNPFKRWYLLPLPLAAAVFAIPAQRAGYVLLIPAVLYVLWTVWSRRMQPDYYDAADHFRLELKILPLPLLFAIILQQASPVEQYSAPYLLAFLLASVLLLRMVRHDENTLRQPKFRLLNLLNLGLVCFVCGLLGSAWFRGLLAMALKGIWRVASVPIYLAMVAVGMGVGYLLELAIPDDFHFEPQQLEGLLEDLGEGEEEKEAFEQMTQQDPETAMRILAVIGILIAILLIIWLFRKLATGKERTPAVHSGIQTRYTIAEPPKAEKSMNRLTARTPAQQVRYWYRQFLKKTQREGGKLHPMMDSRQQTGHAQEVFRREEDTLARLRELYLPARYKDTATADDAKAAKELVKQLGTNGK